MGCLVIIASVLSLQLYRAYIWHIINNPLDCDNGVCRNQGPLLIKRYLGSSNPEKVS